MTIDANKALVRRYLDEVWPGGAPAEPFFGTRHRRHLDPAAPLLDGAAQAARIRAFPEAFPDIRFALVALVAEGDRVVLHCRVTGTLTTPSNRHQSRLHAPSTLGTPRRSRRLHAPPRSRRGPGRAAPPP